MHFKSVIFLALVNANELHIANEGHSKKNSDSITSSEKLGITKAGYLSQGIFIFLPPSKKSTAHQLFPILTSSPIIDDLEHKKYKL